MTVRRDGREPKSAFPNGGVSRNNPWNSSMNLSGIENFDFPSCVLDLKTRQKVITFGAFSGRVRGLVKSMHFGAL